VKEEGPERRDTRDKTEKEKSPRGEGRESDGAEKKKKGTRRHEGKPQRYRGM